MPDRSLGRPAALIFDDPAWRRAIPDLARLAQRAVQAAGGADTVVFASDRAVRRLNHAHRGKNKPTNVLSFEPVLAGETGELVLAFGTIRREAAAGRRRLADHVAHLLVHGALHLAGADHAAPGEARRMEMREARILHRLRVPNPWKPRAVAGGGLAG